MSVEGWTSFGLALTVRRAKRCAGVPDVFLRRVPRRLVVENTAMARRNFPEALGGGLGGVFNCSGSVISVSNLRSLRLLRLC